MKKYLTITTATALLLVSSAQASSWQTKLAELKELAEKITHLKLQLKSAHQQKASLKEQLQETELAVAKLSRNIEKINLDLAKQQATLNRLQNQLAEEQAKLAQQQQQLRQELRSAYMLGNTDSLKLLLNQQDPNELSQTMTYYHYLMAAQVNAIAQVKQTIQHIQEQQLAIQAHADELQSLHKQHQQEQQHLLTQKRKRERLLTDISTQIENKAEQLNELNENQHNLENIINKLKAEEAARKTVSFPVLHGKHPWPLRGPLLARFGTPIENSELNWKGILIGATDGAAVNAVAPGKVIFANWLKGFGFLIILDHGNGYMTLYGRNESLYKNTGDIVQTGELIARAGRSGGFAQSGLYFEVRHNGIPINPISWLS